jgi:hypothetical protein
MGREVSQEANHLVGAEILRMAIAVEADEASNPVDVGLLGADAVVLEANAGANDKSRRGGESDGLSDGTSVILQGLRRRRISRSAY